MKARNYAAKNAPKSGAGRHLDKRARLQSRAPKHRAVHRMAHAAQA